VDTAVDEGQMKVGRRLAIKVLNASRFALTRLGTEAVTAGGTVSMPLDLAMLRRLADLVVEATSAMESYDYARSLERTEAFFWSFCDDYLELVKTRAYEDSTGPGPTSARAALAIALSVQLRLLAPFLPFVTEEVWSWWHAGSIHNARWPSAGEFDAALLGAGPVDEAVLEVAADILGQVRRAKTTAKRSMRSPVAVLTVTGSAERIAALRLAEDDLIETCGVQSLVTGVAEVDSVEVVLADED
jgi:valyl-tRNA synthetase